MGPAIRLDLEPARRQAERAAEALRAMFAAHDVAPFAYAREVRIAPLVVPHSHPVLTLNTAVAHSPAKLLRTWLHEQMHWYAVWFAHRRPDAWDGLLRKLDASHPDRPAGPPDGAADDFSTLLHLPINRLEIIAASSFLGEEAATQAALAEPFYRWCYATAVRDAAMIDARMTEAGLLPLLPATRWTDEDRALAADAPAPPGAE